MVDGSGGTYGWDCTYLHINGSWTCKAHLVCMRPRNVSLFVHCDILN